MRPQCFVDYEGAAYFDAAQTFEGTRAEPLLRCRACGTEHPLGDWPGSALLIGHLAVEFHNWSDLAPAFEQQLRRRMSGRTQVMECHV